MLAEGSLIGAVTGNVAVKLGVPKFRAGFRSLPALPAVMAMPETAMNKEYRAISREHYVRVAGKVSPVQAVAESFAKEHGADELFRTGIAAFDRGHHP